MCLLQLLPLPLPLSLLCCCSSFGLTHCGLGSGSGSRGGAVVTDTDTHASKRMRVCRVQLPCVGPLEKLTVGLSSSSRQASWLLEQVEVTDEATGVSMCG